MCNLKTKWNSIALKARWSICLSAIAIILAVFIRFKCPGGLLAYLLVGTCALGTPVWFICEWSKLIKNQLSETKRTTEEIENFKYEQELARNVWVAMVVVLAAITGIEWGG